VRDLPWLPPSEILSRVASGVSRITFHEGEVTCITALGDRWVVPAGLRAVGGEWKREGGWVVMPRDGMLEPTDVGCYEDEEVASGVSRITLSRGRGEVDYRAGGSMVGVGWFGAVGGEWMGMSGLVVLPRDEVSEPTDVGCYGDGRGGLLRFPASGERAA
jgi:hypothetical protein